MSALCPSAHRRPLKPHASSWQQALREAYTSVAALVEDGRVPAELIKVPLDGPTPFLRIPRDYAAQFDPALGLMCPLLRQSVPGLAEADPLGLPDWAVAHSRRLYGRDTPWGPDPIGDVHKLAAPRLTHRYRQRALLHVAQACALVCRYCFRKHELQSRHPQLYTGALAPAWAYIAAHPEIEEIIVTGGDPLTLSDEGWRRLLQAADAIAHVRVLRVHSRMPAILPERITHALVRLWQSARVRVVFAAHLNHARELGEKSLAALRRLQDGGIGLFHQAVLLAGVNDTTDALADLFTAVYQAGVRPFALHHPDYAQHTWGFRVGIERGRALVQSLQGRISGPALPRYVLDVPGGHGKIDLMGFAVQRERVFAAADGVAGSLWSLVHPHTRESCGPVATDSTPAWGRALYLDLHPAH